nr:reverse transcriptase domain-containing protein [Tanacetum cinerariifolium]
STVTYTSISSDSDGPSWGIPLMNANEFPEIDPYEEVAQQGQEPSEGSDETEPFKEDETAVTSPPPRHRKARIPIRPQTPMAASTQAPLAHRTTMIRMRVDIPVEDMPPQRRFRLTAPPPRCDVAESSASAAARAPRSQYDFVDTVEAGHEDVGYVRSLQDSEHRMMTFIVEVNLRTDRRDIRLEINVVRGQKTAYETELQENHACNKTRNKRRHDSRIHSSYDRSGNPKNSTHTQDDASQSSGRGLRRPVQPARICSYIDFMKCQPLNFKGTKGVVGLSQWFKKIESVFHINGCAVDNQVKFATCTLLGAALTWWNGHVRTLGHEAAYAMTWETLKKKM